MSEEAERKEPETVFDILADERGEPRPSDQPESDFIEVESALEMPRIDGTPSDPEPGIYFDMPEEEYHALPCFNVSGAKHILASPTLFWANSWLNPDKKEKSLDHYTEGKAYHAMVLEGPKSYTERFHSLPDKADYPDALEAHVDIKAAIIEAGEKPLASIIDGEKKRTAKKIDHATQLHALDPRIHIWDILVTQATKRAAGRTLLKSEVDRQIKVAARMISQDPSLARAVSGGWPEVTFIWRDPRQGVLCKARIDYLKLKAQVDLKTYQNSKGRSAYEAIRRSIADTKLTLQPPHYLQGGEECRKLVRAHGASAIHTADPDKRGAQVEWAMRWAQFEGQDEWLWLFQQKGISPITRGYWFRTAGSHFDISSMMLVDAVRRFRECAEQFGVLPWIDVAPIGTLSDDELLPWGLEI